MRKKKVKGTIGFTSVNDINITGLFVILILFSVIIILLLNPRVDRPNIGLPKDTSSSGAAVIVGGVDFQVEPKSKPLNLPFGCRMIEKGCSVGVASLDGECSGADLWPQCSIEVKGVSRGGGGGEFFCGCEQIGQAKIDTICNQEHLVEEAEEKAEEMCRSICENQQQINANLQQNWVCNCPDSDGDGKCDLSSKDAFNNCYNKNTVSHTEFVYNPSTGKFEEVEIVRENTEIVCWYPKVCSCDKEMVEVGIVVNKKVGQGS